MDKLAELLEKASQQLGVAVEQLYAVLLQQAKVELVFDVLIIIGLLVLIALGIFAIKFCTKKANEDYYSDWEVGAMVSTAFTVITAVVSILGFIPIAIREIVQILINPPVWVLEYLVRMFS